MSLRNDLKNGERLAKRRGIYGGCLNLRKTGTIKELTEWIAYYKKQVANGSFCPIRGEKIIEHFESILETKRNK